MGFKPILDQEITGYEQRSQIIVGCENEIKFVQEIYEKWNKKMAAVHQ
jgi:fructose-1,6-bisphosphatase